MTMLGIIIGVAAVIIIMAVGAGAQSLILSQVQSLGTNLIGVLPGKSDDDGPPASAMGIIITTLKYSDLEKIRQKKNVPNLAAAVGYTKGVGTVTWNSNTYDTNISGCTFGYLETEDGKIARGRFFTHEEEKNLSKVAVLGYTVKKELFNESDAIGKNIKIKKHTFKIIGVMEKRGTVAFQDYDDQVFIPLRTVQKLITGTNHLGLIRAKIDQKENINQAISDIKLTLRDQHDIKDSSGASDDFSIKSAAEALDMITTITNALKYFLTAMAAMSLLVGGIGIMNIMLVNVTERTREIGLRKALGAKNSNIMGQFLAEATTMTFFGGLIGIVIGVFISYLASVVIKLLGYDWSFIISLFSIILAVTVSMIVGLIFGIYPAKKASKLQPIEALRRE